MCVEQAEEQVLVVGGNAGRCRATERRIDAEDDCLNHDEGKKLEFLLVSQVEEPAAEAILTWMPGATCDVTPHLGSGFTFRVANGSRRDSPDITSADGLRVMKRMTPSCCPTPCH